MDIMKFVEFLIGFWLWVLVMSFLFILPISFAFSGEAPLKIILTSTIFILSGGYGLYQLLK